VGESGRRCSARLAVWMLTLAVVFPGGLWGAGAQAGTKTATKDRERMSQAVERTLQEGVNASLPPHISTLLGLTRETECPVKQGVLRNGKIVQGIDVSTANHNDVILFTVNETTKDQTLYLSSKTGVLRKVVKVEAGDGKVQRITAEDRSAFEKERQFWLDQLAPAIP